MKNLTILFALIFGLALRAQEAPVAFTYLHIDKNIYVPGETIWFKAYFPSNTKKLNETVLVRLTDAQRNIMLSREFAAYDLRANGQLVLPDSIKPGTYTLFAYGNNTGPDAADVFTQSINIVDNTDGRPLAAISIAEGSTLATGKTITLNLGLVCNSSPLADVKGRCTISIMGSQKPLISERVKTDMAGNTTLTFTYPDIGDYNHLVAEGSFTVDKTSIPFSLTLPSAKRKITITATPEGGTAVAGVENSIAITALDDSGKPVSGVTLTLLENGKETATTTTDAQGQASIKHKLQNTTYSIVAALPAQNFTAEIPLTVATEGLSLIMASAERMLVRNPGAAQQVRLELWTQGSIIFSKEVSIGQNGVLPITLPPAVQNMVVSAALYAKNGTLLNERLFYVGTKNGYNIAVDFGIKKITTRQNVTATLTVTDAEGNPVQANLSAAIVHQRLLDKARYKTITASRYSRIANTAALQNVLQQEPKAINAFLADKKWRGHYPNFAPADSLHLITAGIKGFIRPKRKNTPVVPQIMMIAPEGPELINPKADGSFYINPENVLAHEGQDCFLFFNDRELASHTLTFTNEGTDFEQQWLNSYTFEQPVYATEMKTPVLPEIPGSTRLEELVIEKKYKGFSDADYQLWVRNYPANCLDYVCEYNILNCPNHHTGFTPIIGQKYVINGRPGIYTQCMRGGTPEPEKMVLLKTITLAEEFPQPKFEGEYDMKYYTTLLWTPNITTDINGKATVQFTTSDLEGKFLMVLQGLDALNTDAIYGEAEVKVGGR